MGTNNKRYIPSNKIKRQITKWEGSTMKKNRSFEAEADSFNKVLPPQALDVLSQEQLDGLYSYSYNVGAKRFKDRVVPALLAYLNGQVEGNAVLNQMYADNDKYYRGLRLRRAAEKAMFNSFNKNQIVTYDNVVNTPEIINPPILGAPNSKAELITPTVKTNTTNDNNDTSQVIQEVKPNIDFSSFYNMQNDFEEFNQEPQQQEDGYQKIIDNLMQDFDNSLALNNDYNNISNIDINNNTYKGGGYIKKTLPNNTNIYYSQAKKRWYDENGKMLVPGKGIYIDKTKKYYMPGTDGSVSRYTIKNWAQKQADEIFIKRKQNELKYSIPVKEENKIITRYDGNVPITIYSNALDSVAKYAKIARVPITEGVGVPFQESRVASSEGRKPGVYYGKSPSNNYWKPEYRNNNYISPVVMLSDWNYYEDNPWVELLNTAKTEEDFEKGRQYTENKMKNFDINIPPILHAMQLYKTGKYNSADPDYKNKVIKQGSAFLNSQEGQEWVNSSKHSY